MAPSAEWQDAYRGIRAMVLGASGFIGRWTAEALHEAGARVHLVARDLSAIDAGLRSRPGIEVLAADLSDSSAVREAIVSRVPHIVFNLAGYGVDRGEQDAERARIINAELPRWIVAALAETRPNTWLGQRVIHTGSALEYGEIGGDLAEHSPPNPTTVYGRTKLAGTQALRASCETRDVRGATARLFTVYGAGEHRGRLLPTLLEARATGDRIPLSAGTQRRDFTYVEDVAEGLLRLGAADVPPGEVVNLATGRLTPVRTFVEIAARELGIAPERLEFGAIPPRAEEMAHDPVAVRRLRALVGWVPSTPIAEGVKRSAGRSTGGH